MKLRINESNQYHSSHYKVIKGPKKVNTKHYNTYYYIEYENHNYSIHDIEIDDDIFNNSLIKDYKAEISRSAPYDDADYVWAKIENGVIKFIKDGHVIDKVDCSTDHTDDFEYSSEYTENLILTALENLENYNYNIEPRIVHN